MKIKEWNTKLLLKVSTYLAMNGMVDLSYNQLREIIEKMEEDELKEKKP